MNSYSKKAFQSFLAAIVLGLTAGAAKAGEGGAGLYIPGSQAFGAGVTPPPGFYATQGFLFYDGKAGASLEGGVVSLRAQKTAFVSLLNVLWVPEFNIAGGRVGFSSTLPYAAYTKLQAGAAFGGVNIVNARTDGWGVGDVSFKGQLGWTLGEFSHTAYASIWVPTGRYNTGFFPSTGKNHYGFDFGWGFTQFWKSAGIELSAAAGIAAELQNPTSRYRNGTALHLDAALGKKFDNGLMIGVAGYAYQQISDDSGPGATLGPFRGRVFGVGPAASYGFLFGKTPVSLNVRHYQEFGVENRFKGHMTTGSITAKF